MNGHRAAVAAEHWRIDRLPEKFGQVIRFDTDARHGSLPIERSDSASLAIGDIIAMGLPSRRNSERFGDRARPIWLEHQARFVDRIRTFRLGLEIAERAEFAFDDSAPIGKDDRRGFGDRIGKGQDGLAAPLGAMSVGRENRFHLGKIDRKSGKFDDFGVRHRIALLSTAKATTTGSLAMFTTFAEIGFMPT